MLTAYHTTGSRPEETPPWSGFQISIPGGWVHPWAGNASRPPERQKSAWKPVGISRAWRTAGPEQRHPWNGQGSVRLLARSILNRKELSYGFDWENRIGRPDCTPIRKECQRKRRTG